MVKSPEKEPMESVSAMFARIAPRYNLMNRLMTLGQDMRWRREVIRRAGLPEKGLVLDLGAGTGDLARLALHQQPGCLPIALDFTLPMMLVGKTFSHISAPTWVGADAECLPFFSGTFDAIVSGFLLRNVTNLHQTLAEQYRVLKSEGRLVALDTTRPRINAFTPLIKFHLHTVIPSLGHLVTGDRQAYKYLPSSTVNFLSAEELASELEVAGFRGVGFRRLMFDTIAIHWGYK